MNITEENDIPQFVLFLLKEENDNIANYRERIEKDKVKVVNQVKLLLFISKKCQNIMALNLYRMCYPFNN